VLREQFQRADQRAFSGGGAAACPVLGTGPEGEAIAEAEHTEGKGACGCREAAESGYGISELPVGRPCGGEVRRGVAWGLPIEGASAEHLDAGALENICELYACGVLCFGDIRAL